MGKKVENPAPDISKKPPPPPAPPKLNMAGKCGCGGELRYMHSEDRMSCNKYAVCPTYDELFEQNKNLFHEGLRYKSALEKIVNVNAMDYEYKTWAKDALAVT